MVDFVDNRVDPATGTIRARGVFPNPDGALIPGFFARLRVPGSGNYIATLVPDEAIVTDQSQKVLRVVGPDDVVRDAPIVPGALFGDLRAIESGIDLKDRIVINGLMQARPGAKVKPQEGSISLARFQPTPAEPQATQPTSAPAANAFPIPATPAAPTSPKAAS